MSFNAKWCPTHSHTLPVLSGTRWERIFSLLAASFHLYNKLPSTTHNTKKQTRCKHKASNFLFKTRPLFSTEGNSPMIKRPSDKSPESMLRRIVTILSRSRQRQFRPYSKLENSKTDNGDYQRAKSANCLEDISPFRFHAKVHVGSRFSAGSSLRSSHKRSLVT